MAAGIAVRIGGYGILFPPPTAASRAFRIAGNVAGAHETFSSGETRFAVSLP
jgi:hypothetical protein